jgi:hypothetical protein
MWKVLVAAGALAVAIVPLTAAVVPALAPAGRGVVVQPASAPTMGTWTSEARTGWSDNAGEARWQFNLRTDQGDNNWGFGLRPSEVQGLPAAAFEGTASDVQFTWTREAGTFRFTGSFDGGRGSGRYQFAPSEAYIAAMRKYGYQVAPADTPRLAVLDVNTAYVRELQDTGYSKLPLDELTRMRIHRVSAADIREFRALAFDGLSTDMLVRLRIHQVTPDFVRGLTARGYRGLLAEDLVKMRIHRVTIEEIDELKTLGFGGLGPDELVKFRIHRVTPAFIREMRAAGFADVTEDQLMKMRIHRVDAQFVKDARADGYAMTSPGDAIDLAIRGPRYTRARRK